MSIKSDHNPDCTHCILSDAIIAFRSGTGAANLVARQRTEQAVNAYAFSDDQLVRFSLLSAFGVLLVDLMAEEPDHRIQQRMECAFQTALRQQWVNYQTGQIDRDH